MTRKTWEIRVQGIRPQGCEFTSFSDARDYCLRLISSHVVQLQRDKHPCADVAGRTEAVFQQDTARRASERPLPNSATIVLPWRPDTSKSFEIARIEPKRYAPSSRLTYVSGA